MPAAQASALLQAIRQFKAAYQGNRQFKDLLSNLDAISSQVTQLESATNPSPGQASAVDAANTPSEPHPGGSSLAYGGVGGSSPHAASGSGAPASALPKSVGAASVLARLALGASHDQQDGINAHTRGRSHTGGQAGPGRTSKPQDGNSGQVTTRPDQKKQKPYLK